MSIKTITLSRLRNDANFQFHSENKNLIEEQTPQTLKIVPLFEDYVPKYNKVDLAFKKIKKSAITEQIQEADRARDVIWKGLVDTNTAALNHFNPVVQASAKQLKIVFDTYGNIAKKSLNEQTSATYNILQELEGKYASDVQTVGLWYWVHELKTRNIAFTNLVRERVDEGSLKVDIVLKKARAQLDEAYYKIAERINALVIVEGAENYEPFIRKLNINIAKYNLLATQASRRNKKGENTQQPEGGSNEN